MYAWLVKKIGTGLLQCGVTSGTTTMMLLRSLRCLLLLGCALCLVGLFVVAILGTGNVPTVVRNIASSEDLLTPRRTEDQLSVEEFEWQKRRFRNDSTPLANWLLSQEDSPAPPKTANRSNPFIILVWEYGSFLERRHLRRFSLNKVYSAWEDCSVKNCLLTYERKELDMADAVIFHLHRTRGVKSLPERQNLQQRWIFLTDESPINTFLVQPQKLSNYDGIFNWSMTYRMDSDVPVPYGRTILKRTLSRRDVSEETMDYNEIDSLEEREANRKLVAILGSNCSGNNNRWHYVKELKSVLGFGFLHSCSYLDKLTYIGCIEVSNLIVISLDDQKLLSLSRISLVLLKFGKNHI
ncbi:uncharacterized protein LOC100120707 [Nasonia vitripennis]|uniref:Fucosyltransferase N-terminal domain-containing protein n=1 Tax=Nasonia vitripennis TaxID=7425 RepID=A0A7M7QUT4_NASVI|nr:uncharacterized protein LOC100120707 [Nasonia vitripennis]